MSLLTLGSARAVLVVALVYSFSGVFNVIYIYRILLNFNVYIIKIHSFTSLTGVGGEGALQGNFGRYRCAAEIAKTSQCIYCYQMKPEFTCYNLFDNLNTIGPHETSERMNFNVIDKSINLKTVYILISDVFFS
jgi:hypothetical protein